MLRFLFVLGVSVGAMYPGTPAVGQAKGGRVGVKHLEPERVTVDQIRDILRRKREYLLAMRVAKEQVEARLAALRDYLLEKMELARAYREFKGKLDLAVKEMRARQVPEEKIAEEVRNRTFQFHLDWKLNWMEWAFTRSLARKRKEWASLPPEQRKQKEDEARKLFEIEKERVKTQWKKWSELAEKKEEKPKAAEEEKEGPDKKKDDPRDGRDRNDRKDRHDARKAEDAKHKANPKKGGGKGKK